MKGTHLDCISATMTRHFAGRAVGTSSEAKKNACVIEVLREFEAQILAASLPDVYLNGQSRDEAFWRTLIGETMTVPLDSTAQKRLAEVGLTAHGSGVQRPESTNVILGKQLKQRSKQLVKIQI